MDLAALGAPAGICFGRLANFVNGELYGRAVSESFPLAVRFPQELFELSGEPHVAARMTEVLARARLVTGGEVSGRVSTIIEAMRLGDPEVIGAMTPLLTPRHPSQLYQALLEGFLVFVFLVWLWRRPQRPWMVAGGFGVSYAIARIIGEFFREPDSHLKAQEFALLHVTRGQLLSVAILLIGAAVMVYAWRSEAPLMGSWRRTGEALPPEAWAVTNEKGAADERRLSEDSDSGSADQKR
jgi:phosphatidylglycerol:prolipoprotein diacylglycerol transferase